MSRVDSRWRTTIPKAVRDSIGLTPGSEVVFVIENGKVFIRRTISRKALDKWQGFLRGKLPAASVDEMMEQLRGERLPPEGEELRP